MEGLPFRMRLKELDLFSLVKKKRLRGVMLALCKYVCDRGQSWGQSQYWAAHQSTLTLLPCLDVMKPDGKIQEAAHLMP